MAVSIASLIESQVLTNAMALYFTASGATRVDAMALFNPAGNAASVVTVAWVPKNGAIGVPNQIQSHNMQPGETFVPFGFIGQVLMPGDMIYAMADTNGLVNLFASGTISS